MPLTFCLDAMRTRFEIVLDAPHLPERDAQAAARAALDEVALAEQRLSLFRKDSLLAHINRAAFHEPVRLDADTFNLLATARAVWLASDGAFDPTIARRMTALGLHDNAVLPDLADDAPPPSPACGGGVRRGSASLTEGATDQPSTHTNTPHTLAAIDLNPTASTIRFNAPVALDLGAIAKGHALDLAGRTLREHAIQTALLHAGTSTVLALGHPPDRHAWSVAVRTPTGDAPSIDLRDAALSVSAHHARSSPTDPATTHILDPRTGQPATPPHPIAAVTAPTATLADAWSTAILILRSPPPTLPRDIRVILPTSDQVPSAED
ncbi:MAG: FAD:protein FMN transferase [Phycisphaerales bacterium]